jgi:hypothetical protein
MLHLNIGVNERPEYHVRKYTLPASFLDLLPYGLKSIKAVSLEGFRELGEKRHATYQLAKALLNLQGVEAVEMDNRSFTVTFPRDCNGPERDHQVVLALSQVLIENMVISVAWLDLTKFSQT